jgi:predicted  nucleic acid-binding Zn-ribbon protein
MAMKNLIENLVALQELHFKTSKMNAGSRTEAQRTIRSEIPEGTLQTFDRFVGRKKKAVSVVRHGVCGECHLQVAVGILGALAFGQGLQQCGNCGRFLYLPKDEPVFGQDAQPKKATRKTGRKTTKA